MKIQNHITVTIITASLLLSGCTDETMIGDRPDSEIQLSAYIEAEQITKSTNPAPEGIYYLGYTTSKDTVSDITIGANGAAGATGIYWMNVAQNKDKKSFFTLSNVKKDPVSGTAIIPDSRDILWASDTKGKNNKLAFTLNHLMAQARVTITKPANWDETIKDVSLENMQNDISFDRKEGIVTAIGNQKIIELPLEENAQYYGSLLPPQNRTDNMALVVVTDKKKYKRVLPFSMDELIGNDQWAGTPLKFRAGYILELTATIKKDLDFTILFTGATLQDWKKIGSTTIPARPSGLYTTDDLKQWIIDFNAVKDKRKPDYVLEKYGEYNDSAWTFYLRRDIDASSITESIHDFTDCTLTRKKGKTYKIQGKTKEALLGSKGLADPGIFETTK